MQILRAQCTAVTQKWQSMGKENLELEKSNKALKHEIDKVGSRCELQNLLTVALRILFGVCIVLLVSMMSFSRTPGFHCSDGVILAMEIACLPVDIPHRNTQSELIEIVAKWIFEAGFRLLFKQYPVILVEGIDSNCNNWQ